MAEINEDRLGTVLDQAIVIGKGRLVQREQPPPGRRRRVDVKSDQIAVGTLQVGRLVDALAPAAHDGARGVSERTLRMEVVELGR